MKDRELADKIRSAIGRGDKPDAEILKLLGENLEVSDANGRTPIFHAVLWNRIDLLAQLIAKGASVRHCDCDGRTPLHFAVQERNLAAANLLLEAGALADAKDQHGNPPLWGAVMQFQGFEEMIRMLLLAGASPDSKNLYGSSPRDLALSQRYGDAAKWLDLYSPNRGCQ